MGATGAAVAGSVAGSVANKALGGKGGGSSSSSQSTIPAWLKPYFKANVKKASEQADKPFTPYTGTVAAPLSTDEQNAFAKLRASMGQQDQYFQGAQGTLADVLNRAQNGPSAQDITNLSNPYVQNVIDINKRKAVEDYDQNMQGLRSHAVNAGAFGGDRSYIQEAMANKNLNTNLGDIQNRGLFDAYNQAMSQYNLGTSTMGQTALSQAGLGREQQAGMLQDVNALAGAGATGRGIEDVKNQFGITQYNQEQQYPWMNIQNLQNVLQGTAAPMGGQVNTSQQNTNPFNQIVGGGLAGAQLGSSLYNGGGNNTSPGFFGNGGIFGSGFGSGGTHGGAYGGGYTNTNSGTINWFKKGGLVKGYADGGLVASGQDAMNTEGLPKITEDKTPSLHDLLQQRIRDDYDPRSKTFNHDNLSRYIDMITSRYPGNGTLPDTTQNPYGNPDYRGYYTQDDLLDNQMLGQALSTGGLVNGNNGTIHTGDDQEYNCGGMVKGYAHGGWITPSSGYIGELAKLLAGTLASGNTSGTPSNTPSDETSLNYTPIPEQSVPLNASVLGPAGNLPISKNGPVSPEFDQIVSQVNTPNNLPPKAPSLTSLVSGNSDPWSGLLDKVLAKRQADAQKPMTFSEKLNTPLMAMGMAMMGTQGTFGEAMSHGWDAYKGNLKEVKATEDAKVNDLLELAKAHQTEQENRSQMELRKAQAIQAEATAKYIAAGKPTSTANKPLTESTKVTAASKAASDAQKIAFANGESDPDKLTKIYNDTYKETFKAIGESVGKKDSSSKAIPPDVLKDALDAVTVKGKDPAAVRAHLESLGYDTSVFDTQ